MPAEAVEKILQHNLFGLDIDLRAAQLAQFAVLLAAATKYPDILKKEITPQIYTMPEAAEFSREEILDFLGSDGIQHQKVLSQALELMQEAKNLGSIMQINVNPTERQFFIQRLGTLQTEALTSLMVQSLFNKIQPFLQVLFILTDRYEAIAANPPYMGQSNMNDDLKNYINANYPISKSDLMTVFMELAISLTIKNGQIGMINLPSWMFLSSFEKLRNDLLSKTFITSLIQHGRGIFGSDFGSVSFCIENSKSNGRKGVYRRLFVEHVKVDTVQTKEKRFLDQNYGFHITDQVNFSKIPSCPIAYWLSEAFLKIFENPLVGDKYIVRKGIFTGDNNRFLRYWFEVEKQKLAVDISSMAQSETSKLKWYYYAKGGDFRKWYGNHEFILNFKNGGSELKSFSGSGIAVAKTTFFKEGILWSKITSGKPSFRIKPYNIQHDDAAPAIIFDDQKFNFVLLGFLNSKVSLELKKIFNPTINTQVGDIKNIPSISDNYIILSTLISQCINLSKLFWDKYETSWDFLSLHLINDSLTLEAAFNDFKDRATTDFYQLHANEEEQNRIFSNIYGLDKELDPIVPLKDITILLDELDHTFLEETDKELRKHREWKFKEGKWQLYVDGQLQPNPVEGELPQATVQPTLPIKKNVVMQQFINYSVGCMMGRYSLDATGLILANQGETIEDYFEKVGRWKSEDRSHESEEGRFLPDDDGIVPMMGSNCGFSDDAVLRLRQFIEAVWGSETLTQNINFLQSCLDMEIEKYLVTQNNFWKDHCSRYKKKPIYWLFSSKKGAFQVLVYMHRMNRFTVQRIRESYMFKHLQWLVNQKAELERRSATLSRDETRQLDTYRTALTECQEYDLQLKNIADQQIEFDLDDGVSMNYEKFEPLLAAIK